MPYSIGTLTGQSYRITSELSIGSVGTYNVTWIDFQMFKVEVLDYGNRY